MAFLYKILTNDGVDNTNIDGARNYYFNSGNRDGIVKGSLNEGTFSAPASNEIEFDTCELRVSGHRLVIYGAWSKTFTSRPSVNERHAVIARVVVDDNKVASFDIIDQLASIKPTKDNLFHTETGAGTYEVEIGRFTLTTNGTVEDVVRTLDIITGGSSGIGEHFIAGDITTTMLDAGMNANITAEDIYTASGDYEKTNFNFELPETAGTVVKVNNVEQANLDFTSDPQTQLNNKVNSSDLTNKMDKANPTGTGALNLNSVNTLGDYAVAVGYLTTADAAYAHAEGKETTASGAGSHAEGANTTASGAGSHAEGANTTASGAGSHAEGNGTTARRRSQHTFGEFNLLDTSGGTYDRGTYVEIVGNGTGNTNRSNARTLDWDGNEKIAGNFTANKTITLTDENNPYIQMTTENNTYYIQSSAGVFAIGAGFDKSTKWAKNGETFFPVTTNFGSNVIFKNTHTTGSPTYPFTGIYNYDGYLDVVAHDADKNWNHTILRVNSVTNDVIVNGVVSDNKTVIMQNFTHAYTQTITTGTPKTALYFGDGSTTVNFISHGRPVLITGTIAAEHSGGGNHYVGLYIDNATTEYSSVTSNSSSQGEIGVNFLITNLSAGTHTIGFKGWTNVGTVVFNSAARTHVIFQEI